MNLFNTSIPKATSDLLPLWPSHDEISGYFEANLMRYQMWRRDLHAHPEIAFEEHRTSAFVSQTLLGIGCDVYKGLAQTGVVGVIRFGGPQRPAPDGLHHDNEDDKPEITLLSPLPNDPKLRQPEPISVLLEDIDQSIPRIGLRADIDALPIHEESDLPYRSKFAGKMHACGHDGHTVMLLAAAEYLIDHPPTLWGEIILIFQPAEENVAGGRVMVNEGLFEYFPVEEVYGLHNLPKVPSGHLLARVGPQMASADFFDVTLKGVGGHAAWPHQCSDLILAASHLIQGWQHIISRFTDPIDSAVLSVTRIQSGESMNALPSTLTLGGTVRALNEETRIYIEQNMKRQLVAMCESYQIDYTWFRNLCGGDFL